VYQTEAEVFGKKAYFIRLGFFSSFDEASAVKDKLQSRFPLAWATLIDEKERETARAGARLKPRKIAKPPAPVTPASKPKAEIAGELPYVVSLASAPKADFVLKPLPSKLKVYRLYTYETLLNGKPWHRLRLGFFASRAEADNVRRSLLDRYPEAWVDLASRQERADSIKTALVMGDPKVLAERPPTESKPEKRLPPVKGPLTVEQLMDKGRTALTRGDLEDAIRYFTRVLGLSNHPHAQEALELLGLARERNRQLGLAQVEYKLYLKLYPEGEGADRVRQRLVNLAPPVSKVALTPPKKRETKGQTDIYGTLSQQYYRGNSKIDTTITSGPTVGEQDTLSLVDQSALVSTFDLAVRHRSERYDNRAVFSGDNSYDRLDSQSESRVSSAYGEIKDRDLHYSVRFGRQSGSSGGVLTRFDGGLASFQLSPRWGLNFVAGEPVDTIALGSDRKFGGMSVDISGDSGRWGTNLYYIRQTIDGIVDREAIGTEVRYFQNGSSIFSLLDYETSYQELNIFLFQGNWLSEKGTSYNLLLDYRNSPTLQTSNALLGESVDSVDDLLKTKTEEQIRQDALDRTTDAKVFSAGVLHPLNKKLQVGADLTVTNISGTPASGMLPATEGTGNVITLAPKAIASSLLFDKDVTIFSAGFTDGKTFQATSLSFTNRVPVGRWRIDTGLRYYKQDNSVGTELTRITPSIKLDYAWKRNLSFQFEYGQENSKTVGLTQNDDSVRDFYTLGYRWDF